jgi:hypothetical protein
MNRVAWICFLAWTFTAANVFAADTFDGVEYIAGHAGAKQHKGRLSITDTELRFLDGSKALFVIPLPTIVSAVVSTEATHGVSGFSWNAVKSQDYVTVKTESAQSAEALVFKIGNKQAAGVAAKIEFAAKKAKG